MAIFTCLHQSNPVFFYGFMPRLRFEYFVAGFLKPVRITCYMYQSETQLERVYHTMGTMT